MLGDLDELFAAERFRFANHPLLEHGRRTATLIAVTDCVVAVASRGQVDRDSLASLAGQHDREGSRVQHAR